MGYISDEAFKGCNNLKIVSFLGDYDPGFDDVFEGCDMLHHICVSIDYDDYEFCCRTDYCKTDSCENLHFKSNECIEDGCLNGDFVSVESKDAAKWENQTNACVDYKCDDKKGFIMETVCKSTNEKRVMCINDGCLLFELNSMRIEIEVKDMKANNFSNKEICDEIELICDVKIDPNDIGFELGDDGTVMQVIIYVDDETSAQTVVDAMNNADKDNDDGKQFIKRIKKVYFVNGETSKISQPIVISDARIIMFSANVLIIWYLLMIIVSA